MSVKSIFEFKFPEKSRQAGLTICTGIGHDMTSLEGYLDHEVIQDAKDPGHLMVNTLWTSEDASTAVLSKYEKDQKIQQATELIGAPPTGFVGTVLANAS